MQDDFEELCAFVRARLEELEGVARVQELVAAQRGLLERMVAQGSGAPAARDLLRSFADEFATHPDFRAEWRITR